MQVTRNLATRLVTKVLTVEVRRTSNSLGICGNKGLDNAKLMAVHDVAMKNYPLKQLQMKAIVKQEMRTAIDTACRQTNKSS